MWKEIVGRGEKMSQSTHLFLGFYNFIGLTSWSVYYPVGDPTAIIATIVAIHQNSNHRPVSVGRKI
jgi:hypothetical protein